jgi:hypothetical protein
MRYRPTGRLYCVVAGATMIIEAAAEIDAAKAVNARIRIVNSPAARTRLLD